MKSRHPNSRNAQRQRNRGLEYQNLEARNMLTVDVGMQIPDASELDLNAPFFTPDVSGDIGPNHTIETVNGEFDVRLINGSLIQRRTMEQFWLASGADLVIGFDMMNNPITGTIQDTRVLYDSDTGKWFVTSALADENGDNMTGNQILLAVSRTNNPVDGFQSVQFVGDTSDTYYNAKPTIAADANGVFITTSNEIDPINLSVSIYAIPKLDLTGIAPSITNLERFENLDPATYGSSIQFASDADADNGRSLGIGTFATGSSTLSILEIENLGTVNPVTLNMTTTVVDVYNSAPDARQLNDVTRLNNISPEITGNAVEHDGYIWTAHTVQGTASNSAIRWYQIDSTTLNLVNSDLVEVASLDFIYPSIDVSSQGVVAIGFTGSGVNQSASSYLTMGFLAQGLDATPTVTFPQDPAVVTQGQNNYINPLNGVNLWGEYSATSFDPDDPFSVYTFQQYVSADDTWSTSIGEAGIADIAPVINADDGDNEVVIQQSLFNSTWTEIVIDGSVTDIFETTSLDGLELNLFGGNDTITIDNSLGQFLATSGFTINGGDGIDLLRYIDSQAHQFDITGDGSGLIDSINVFSGLEALSGGDGNDIFTSMNSASDWSLTGGAGDDLFDIGNSSTGTYSLAGQEGNDSYRLPLANFDMITVIDSIDDEFDSLIGLGTMFDDTLLINNETLIFNNEDVSVFGQFDGIEQLDFDGLEGNDTFDIQAIAEDLTVSGSEGDDTFNISSDAPTNEGVSTDILGALTIDGGDGNNQLAISNAAGFPLNVIVTADQISGMTIQPITFTGNFGSADDGTPGIILTGSDIASDVFDIRQLLEGNSLFAIGGAGNDVFNVRPATVGDVYLDGGANADTYRTTFSTTADHSVMVIDSGTDADRDRFSIRVTEGDDAFNIGNMSLNSARNFLSWTSSLENLVVDTLGGNDTATVRSDAVTFLRVALGDGNDTGIVTGTTGISTVKFQGQAGNDAFDFQGSIADSFVQALGGDGDDSFVVGGESFARSRVDGEAGNDNVDVTFAARDNRRVNARDTGGGFDALLVNGTMAADRVDLQNRLISREGEFVTYDENTDQFDMELIGSNDVLNIYGSSVLEFDANLGVGNDTVNVFATSTPNASVGFDISLSSGNDTGNIFRVAENARVNIFGQDGNDKFNVGSNSTDDTGNLSRIRGDLFVQGGSDNPGVDSLQVNDFAAIASFAYVITDTQFNHDAANSAFDRPFAGFNHSGMEFIFAAGTDADNRFTVTPSLTSVIRVIGRGGFDSLDIQSSEDRQLFGSAAEGFLEFSEGSQNVSFFELENLSDAV